MKRTLSLILAGLLCLTATACGEPTTQPEETPTTTTQPEVIPAITVEDFTWELTTEKEGKDTYVAVTFQNHSAYTLHSFKLKFQEKENLTDAQRDAYWADLKKSRGEDEESNIDEMRATIETYGAGLQMFGKTEEPVAPGATVTMRCLLNDQMESRNVIHLDLYDPYMMELTYQEGDVTQYIRYNFHKDTYFIDQM